MPFALPEARYAKSGDVNIAYQVVGDGSPDLLWVPGWISNVEAGWDVPEFARCFDRLASFSRLILFDKRGTGLSDPVSLDRLPTLEQRMDDVRAVLDAVGSEQATVVGSSEGGNLCVLYAAAHPERVRALVLIAAYVKRVWSEDYPWAPTPEEREREHEVLASEWAGEMDLATLAPSAVGNPELTRRIATYFRRSASPGTAVALNRINSEIDTRAVLTAISVPTLVLHRVGDRDVNIEEGRWIAAHISDAKLVELPGDDHLPFVGDTDALLDELEEFVTGVHPAGRADRVLATVLFTDIVGATERAAQVGDRRWRELLAEHHAAVRRELDRWRGREVDTAGDGFLITFDGPARAIGCAHGISDAVRALDLEIRAGLHAGEVEIMGEKVAGIAVHTGARVAGLAAPGEVLVSQTVKDLVAGSGIEFEERGEHELKGVPGTWRLYAVVDV